MEILSPAGSFESVQAAVLNGANAVYLGQQAFNARQHAENFDYDMLQQAIAFCHLHHVKVYQTLNTLVFDEEREALQRVMITACELGVDALIVQDFGVVKLARTICPNMRLHASTQMTVHTLQGVKLLEQLGIKRVVLSRELTISEIEQIAKNTHMELEVFAHGALCMSVSGQCYFSAMIGGRSGNQGNCAGTCRLPFGKGKANSYDLSLKDLCAVNQYHRLEQIGVASLKIEGRMKRPEYVAAATKVYVDLSKGIMPDTTLLQAVFSRDGFTDGYLTGNIDENMFGIRQKENVLAATDQVFSRLRETYHKEKPFFPVDIHFTLKEGQPAMLQLTDEQDNRVKVTGEIPEIAKTRPTDLQTAKEALEKWGGTPFYLQKFEAQIQEGLILPKSKLNELRRKAAEALKQVRTAVYPVPYQAIQWSTSQPKVVSDTTYRARFGSVEQIPFQMMDTWEFIYLPIRQVLQDTDQLLPYCEKIILELDRVMFGTESSMISLLKTCQNLGFSNLAASNPAHIKMAQMLGFTCFGTHFLNITNSWSAQQYLDLGISDMVLSIEATMGQLCQIHPQKTKTGVIIYGYLPLMVMRNCPVKKYARCTQCQNKQSLTDRRGKTFQMICNQQRYSELLNCHPLQLSDKQDQIKGFDFGVFYFTTETKSECKRMVKRYQDQEKPQGEFTRGLYFRGLNQTQRKEKNR